MTRLLHATNLPWNHQVYDFSVVDGRWRGREAILDLDFTISHRCKCQFCQKRFSLRVLALRRVCTQMTIVAMRPCCKTGAKVVLRRSTTLIKIVYVRSFHNHVMCNFIIIIVTIFRPTVIINCIRFTVNCALP